MAQFDVYANPSTRSRAEVPFLVDVQSNLLSMLETRFVAPLVRTEIAPTALPARMCPMFQIEGQRVMLRPQEAAPIGARLLGPPVQSLNAEGYLIVDAFDAVISGV